MEYTQEILRSLQQVLGALPLSALLMPVVGAVIGWSTNYLAVKMLFHPRNEVNFLLFKVQGVFPKRQKEFAHKLGSVVSNELLSVSDVTDKIVLKATSPEVLDLVAKKIEYVLTDRIPAVFPMASMFIGPETIATLKNSFMGELESLMGDVVRRLSSDVEEEIDIHGLVEEKVAHFSSEKLEEIVFAIMKREFRFIEVVGAVVGFVIGVVQLAFLILSS